MRPNLYMRSSAPQFAVIAATALTCAAGSANAALLHSNGPFITNPTGGTGSIAGLPISNSDGFTVPGSSFVFSTTGVGATVSANTAVAEDFTVDNGGWLLRSLTVYAFQTSQTTPTVTQVRVNLWRDTPYSAGSPDAPAVLPTPVFTNDLVYSAGPGTFVAHRQSPTGTSTNRPVFAYTVQMPEIEALGFLPEGRYWIQWSFLGASSPSANVFTPLVSPRTAVTGHNARLLNSIDGSAAGPRVWFEGREGFVAGQADGRAYELPYELNGSFVPTPGAAGVLMFAAGAFARRRR
jgi:hypothetical protein